MVFYGREAYRCLKSLCTQCKACVKNPHKEEAAVNDSSFNTSDFASPLQPNDSTVPHLFITPPPTDILPNMHTDMTNTMLHVSPPPVPDETDIGSTDRGVDEFKRCKDDYHEMVGWYESFDENTTHDYRSLQQLKECINKFKQNLEVLEETVNCNDHIDGHWVAIVAKLDKEKDKAYHHWRYLETLRLYNKISEGALTPNSLNHFRKVGVLSSSGEPVNPRISNTSTLDSFDIDFEPNQPIGRTYKDQNQQGEYVPSSSCMPS